MEIEPGEQLDPTGPTAPYMQIAAVLRRRIERGDFPANTRIPTESDLVAVFEVARTTARRAIALLREEGLVYTVPQRGTFVAERKPGDGTDK
ncbi:GntR family transcriptional regulator [Actinoallomurus sp. NPDC052308]|uniref:GntR family transcriptional regulator n=1 Tax=Actinoallomurus sp. NPDC052308 TaxID=3155530 RepID=UPI003444B910